MNNDKSQKKKFIKNMVITREIITDIKYLIYYIQEVLILI